MCFSFKCKNKIVYINSIYLQNNIFLVLLFSNTHLTKIEVKSLTHKIHFTEKIKTN